MLTLEPPSVNKGLFPLKIPRPAGQSRSKMAEMQFFLLKALYWSIFLKMTHEFDSIRSRSANIINQHYLLVTTRLLVYLVGYFQLTFSPCYQFSLSQSMVCINLVHHGCSSGLLGPHPTTIHYNNSKLLLSLNNTVCDNYANYTNKHVTKRT